MDLLFGLIGAFGMGAGMFGKAVLAEKHLAVFLAGGVAMSIGIGLNQMGGECRTSWGERGSYEDC